ncbi:hypothetical protein [Flavobacterium sp.]|uniref:hypothetical protein n=1 Tax=Flavobacterium sp. TaxID=239 RepID=UPI0037C01088
MSDFKKWREQGRHLPSFMRDFHDQKDIFKAMLNYFSNAEDMPVNWQDGHVFTVDWFLWFMAAHGYTLQKTKAKCDDFHDLSVTIESARAARADQFSKMIGQLGGQS